MGKKKAYINWSGGKDAAMALHLAQQDATLEVGALLTSMNAAHNTISMHGVRHVLLQQQAAAIGLPLFTASLPEQPTMEEYNNTMGGRIGRLYAAGFRTAISGDIFLEDLKQFRENELAKHGIDCRFPLWQMDPGALMKQFFAAGFKAVVVCVNGDLLDPSFCGRLLDASFIADLPAHVDPCGEKGAYHSFVFDGPIFKQPVRWNKGALTTRTYPAPKIEGSKETNAAYTFYYCDLEPVATHNF